MSKLNYDDETAKSLDQKLKDFYARWDSTPAEAKQKMIDSVTAGLKSIAAMDLSVLSPEEKQQVKAQLKQLITNISDIRLALGHRIAGQTDAINEQIKRLAEEGNTDAIKAWETLKDDYQKSRYDKLTDN